MARKPRRVATKPPQTTAQRLDSIVKSARRIMRKDKGLSGELDRLPMLTWLMFLKFLDDFERVEEDKAVLAGRPYRAVIEPPYRWRDWADNVLGLTGDDLLRFINSETNGPLPDGGEGQGLLAYLRSLRGEDGRRDRRDVVANAFRGVQNRMISGYNLRDVVNLLAGIHFDSSDEVHTLGRLYETLLREMRDAAGDSGEFYTPRPVVQLMVKLVDPKLGEAVLDPAAGTGGFLCEAFLHLMAQAKTTEDVRTVQESSIFGAEPKPLPYLLCQMNLLLHGMEAPDIDPGNSLRFRLAEMGDAERVDVVLTNPPFGGEEEPGIQNNFPGDRRTAETALLFMQVVMRRLKRGGAGRCGIVVPNGFLFGDGVCAKIKADLIERFNLHLVVRLPEGIFSPYTDIPTNLLFFDSGGPTEETWFYEQPLPEGRRKYSKTMPLRSEEFEDLVAWACDRKSTDRAWMARPQELVRRDEAGEVKALNLDLRNPNVEDEVDARTPEQLVGSIIAKEKRVLAIMSEIQATLAGTP
jgi:type I restriction enzyme M protein